MAAFLDIAPPYGAAITADTIRRLDRSIRIALARRQEARPTLACRWLQDADGRLSCFWEVDLPIDIPIPPD
jgi:hypothetical protein